jgi:hypothetical protein
MIVLMDVFSLLDDDDDDVVALVPECARGR